MPELSFDDAGTYQLIEGRDCFFIQHRTTPSLQFTSEEQERLEAAFFLNSSAAFAARRASKATADVRSGSEQQERKDLADLVEILQVLHRS